MKSTHTIPTHIAYDVRDAEGWPTALSKFDKDWAIKIIGEALSESGERGLTLMETTRILFEDPNPTRPVGFWIGLPCDAWAQAVSYHVLTKLDTNQVWVPFELRKEYREDD